MKYKVTGIIPCHNHAKWVHHAIVSMTGQITPPDRIVVIDNGSTDGSAQKVIDSATKIEYNAGGTPQLYYSDVPVFLHSFEEPLGPAKARNFGIRTYWDGTDIFAMLDSDDRYSIEKIAESLRVFKTFGDGVGVVYSDYHTHNQDNDVFLTEYKYPFDSLLLRRDCIINNDSLISKKALEKVGLYDEEMRVCEDYDLWIRISKHFMNFHIPEPLVTLNTGSHSSTATVPKAVWQENWRRIAEKNNG